MTETPPKKRFIFAKKKQTKGGPPSDPTLKKCPVCGEEILKVALKCKHCGEFINKNHTSISSVIANPPKKKGSLAIALGLFCVLICWLFVGFLGGRRSWSIGDFFLWCAIAFAVVGIIRGRPIWGLLIILLSALGISALNERKAIYNEAIARLKDIQEDIKANRPIRAP